MISAQESSESDISVAAAKSVFDFSIIINIKAVIWQPFPYTIYTSMNIPGRYYVVYIHDNC